MTDDPRTDEPITDDPMTDTPKPFPTEVPFRLLLCTNGSKETRPALEYGAWLGHTLGAQVYLLGVVEAPNERSRVEALVDQAASNLEAKKIPFEIQFEAGRGTVVIARKAAEGGYLTVAGPLGRPAWRRVVQGRSFRRLLSRICYPLLYVPVARLPISHILLTMGGLGYSFSVEQMVLYLARAVGASLTVLHVVERVNLAYPVAEEIQSHWEQILETDTPQAQNLNRALDELRRAGLEVHFRVRHGDPVGEIQNEVRGSDYDLVAMGSSYSGQSLRRLYMPNVTAEVAETMLRPVLTVRQGFFQLDE